MPKITIALAGVLIALGLYAYFVLSGDERSVTALIPAFAGAAFFVIGVVGLKPGARKVAMHVAVVLAVLGVAGTIKGLLAAPALLTDRASLERPNAVAVQAIMCVLCLVYVGLAVASFVKARKGRD